MCVLRVQVYAFTNAHDVSWGTKGLSDTKKAGEKDAKQDALTQRRQDIRAYFQVSCWVASEKRWWTANAKNGTEPQWFSVVHESQHCNGGIQMSLACEATGILPAGTQIGAWLATSPCCCFSAEWQCSSKQCSSKQCGSVALSPRVSLRPPDW